MPGIVGIISRKSNRVCEKVARSMVAIMQHEAFYNSGSFSEPEFGVYVGWVAHESSFAAKQPFFNEQKDVALFFSGECFHELAASNKLGVNDDEIAEKKRVCLVNLYQEKGDRF